MVKMSATEPVDSHKKSISQDPREHSIVKNTDGCSIVWDPGFRLGKYILGFFKNIDLDNS